MHFFESVSKAFKYLLTNGLVFVRRLRHTDVPTSLAKSLPESCTLYVISKGKMQNIRPTGPPHNIKGLITTTIKDVITLLQNSPLVHSSKVTSNAPPASEDINRYVH